MSQLEKSRHSDQDPSQPKIKLKKKKKEMTNTKACLRDVEDRLKGSKIPQLGITGSENRENEKQYSKREYLNSS